MKQKVCFCIALVFLLFPYGIISADRISFSKIDNKLITQKSQSNFKLDHICKKESSSTWCIPFDYDKDVEPWKYRSLTNTTLPWYYHFHFHIFDVQEVNDMQQTIMIDMYFDIRWLEPRLMINPTADDWENEDNPHGFIPIPLKDLEYFWFPDLEMYELSSYQSQKIVKPMTSLKVNKDGLFRYNSRVNIILTCQMDFRTFPFDSHQCIIRVGSFYNHQEVVNCTASFFYTPEQQRSLQYMIDIFHLPVKFKSYEFMEKDWATCGFNIILERIKTQIFFQVYLTSALLVIVSWMSFMIQPGTVPGRMGLLITVFLVLINIFISVKRTSPVSNGLNAVDVFLVVCIGEVFAALLEYALVLHIYGERHEKSFPEMIKSNVISQKNTNEIHGTLKHQSQKSGNGWVDNTAQTTNSKNNINLIDKVALILYSLFFASFMIIYFTLYVQ